MARQFRPGRYYWSTMEDVKAKLKMSALRGRAGYACARVITSPQFAPALLVTVLLWEFGVLFFEASRKPFWYDELLTFYVSSLQPFPLFWSALTAGVDGMPLGYYLLVRVARILPGDPHVTLRLPSILGYLMTLLGVYWFSRKRLPAIAGLAAVFLITLSPFRGYAVEARSYSLLVGFLAISAVLWQRIDEKRFMTPLLALFLTLAVSSHHLAVVAISSFGIAEFTWTLLSGRIRWGVWAACLLATSPFFVGLPIPSALPGHFRQELLVATGLGNGHLGLMDPTWGLTSRLALVLIAFFGIVVGDSLLRMYRTPGKGSLDERDFRPPEIILVGGFLYFPCLAGCAD